MEKISVMVTIAIILMIMLRTSECDKTVRVATIEALESESKRLCEKNLAYFGGINSNDNGHRLTKRQNSDCGGTMAIFSFLVFIVYVMQFVTDVMPGMLTPRLPRRPA